MSIFAERCKIFGQNHVCYNDQEWWAFWEVESDYRGAHKTMDVWNTHPSRQAILVLDSKGSARHLLSDYPVKHEFLGFSHCKLLWTRNHVNSTSWALLLNVLLAVLITTIHGCGTYSPCPWPCLIFTTHPLIIICIIQSHNNSGHRSQCLQVRTHFCTHLLLSKIQPCLWDRSGVLPSPPGCNTVIIIQAIKGRILLFLLTNLMSRGIGPLASSLGVGWLLRIFQAGFVLGRVWQTISSNVLTRIWYWWETGSSQWNYPMWIIPGIIGFHEGVRIAHRLIKTFSYANIDVPITSRWF